MRDFKAIYSINFDKFQGLKKIIYLIYHYTGMSSEKSNRTTNCKNSK